MTEFALTPSEPIETRFSQFKAMLFAAFRDKYKRAPRWDGAEQNQLAKLLKGMPELTILQFQVALANIFNSGDIPKGERPSRWLPRLDSYIEEHHNVFGRNPSDAMFDYTAKKRAEQDRLRMTEPGVNWRPN